MLRDEALQLDHNRRVLATTQVRVYPVLHSRQPPLLETDRGGLPKRKIRHGAQRRPPPQAQPPPQSVGRRGRIAGGQLPAAQLGQLLELSEVDSVRIDR